MQIKHIIAAIEDVAPPALQESWDNSGLQVGDPSAECTGVLLCLDPTPQVIAEAVSLGCNLVVSHHPLLFRGLKRISGATPTERCVLDAIRSGVTVYSSHTALDSAAGGVSYAIAEALGAKVERVLHPMDGSLLRLVVYAPREQADDVRAAIADIDSGVTRIQHVVSTDSMEMSEKISTDADGLPLLDISHKPLTSLTFIIPAIVRRAAEAALSGMVRISYNFQKIEDVDWNTGLGVIATFDKAVNASSLIEKVKTACNASSVRCSTLPPDDSSLQRIAICGGAGGEFIVDAVRAGADAYITADIRYHDFAEWADRIFIVDAGHYETESCTKTLFMQLIKEKFANFAVYISTTEKNPINYL